MIQHIIIKFCELQLQFTELYDYFKSNCFCFINIKLFLFIVFILFFFKFTDLIYLSFSKIAFKMAFLSMIIYRSSLVANVPGFHDHRKIESSCLKTDICMYEIHRYII